MLRRRYAAPSSQEEKQMSADTIQAHEAAQRLEHADLTELDRPGFDRRAFLRRSALTGVAAGSVSTILAACGSSASSGGSSGSASLTSFLQAFASNLQGTSATGNIINTQA